MSLFSLICLMAYKLTKGQQLPILKTAWYDKNSQATFSDVIRFVKTAIIRKNYINTLWINNDVVQIPIHEFENLINHGLIAA